jgi:tyrosinase
MSVNLRENIEELSDNSLTDLREAFKRIMEIQDNRGYNYIAGFHGVPGWYCWHHGSRSRGDLSRPFNLFCPWHRAYLYWFEQFLKDRLEHVNLPWWNWSSEASRTNGIPKAFSDEFVNGTPNPLYKAHILVPNSNPPFDEDTRRDPQDPSDLPTPQMIAELLELNDFDDFDIILENIHDQIHGWVGGSMGLVSTAAYDPLFWSHHCMVDRLWYLWQLRHGFTNGMQDMLDEVLEPFPLKVRDVIDIRNLGYEYAVAQISVSV